MTSPSQIIDRFVRAINQHDTEAIAALLTNDHTFMGTEARQLQGRELVTQAWHRFFE